MLNAPNVTREAPKKRTFFFQSVELPPTTADKLLFLIANIIQPI